LKSRLNSGFSFIYAGLEHFAEKSFTRKYVKKHL